MEFPIFDISPIAQTHPEVAALLVILLVFLGIAVVRDKAKAAELAKTVAEIDRKRAENFAATEGRERALEHRVGALTREIYNLHGRLNQMQGNYNILANENAALRSAVAERDQDVDVLRKYIETLRQELQTSQRLIAALEHRISELTGQEHHINKYLAGLN